MTAPPSPGFAASTEGFILRTSLMVRPSTPRHPGTCRRSVRQQLWPFNHWLVSRSSSTPVIRVVACREPDGIVSEKDGTGASLAMTTPSPIGESQEFRAAPGAFLQHLPPCPRESVQPVSRRLSRIDLQPFDLDRLAGASVRPHFRMVAAFVVRRKREQLPVRCRPYGRRLRRAAQARAVSGQVPAGGDGEVPAGDGQADALSMRSTPEGWLV